VHTKRARTHACTLLRRGRSLHIICMQKAHMHALMHARCLFECAPGKQSVRPQIHKCMHACMHIVCFKALSAQAYAHKCMSLHAHISITKTFVFVCKSLISSGMHVHTPAHVSTYACAHAYRKLKHGLTCT